MLVMKNFQTVKIYNICFEQGHIHGKVLTRQSAPTANAIFSAHLGIASFAMAIILCKHIIRQADSDMTYNCAVHEDN